VRSKKPFAASCTSPQPPDIVYFVDRSLGRQTVPAALRAAGMRVEVHDDHFLPDAPDEEWLRVAGERGWAVLTKDAAIRWRPLERDTLLAAGVRAFVLTAKRLTGAEIGQAFVRARGAMEDLLRRRTQRPFIASVSRHGRVQVIFRPRRVRRGGAAVPRRSPRSKV
jgi:hypothetical protein